MTKIKTQNAAYEYAEKDRANLSFPEYLGGISEERAAPNSIALFSALLQDGDVVNAYNTYLPGPTGLSVADSANFNQEDFGFFGNRIGEQIKGLEAISGQRTTQGFKEALTLGQVNSNQVSKKDKFITNPTTNTTFTGNGIRKFSFTYKFVPESQLETDMIKRIIRRFRSFVYASYSIFEGGVTSLGNDVTTQALITYPPIWQILFLQEDLENNQFVENAYMPRIDRCFLESVETNYNPNTNMYFAGGAPSEIDLTLNYTETSQLTRDTVNILEKTLDAGSFNPVQPKTEEGFGTPRSLLQDPLTEYRSGVSQKRGQVIPIE